MRFIIGLLIGFGAGFAGAVLLAPDRSKTSDAAWPAAPGASTNGTGRNGNTRSVLRRFVRSLQEQIDEAMAEAKQASAETEAEMRARYDKATGRKPKAAKK